MALMTQPSNVFFRPWEMKTSVTDLSSPTSMESLTFQEGGQTLPHKKSPSRQNTNKKCLNPKAVDMMEKWYIENYDHPYPCDTTVQEIVGMGGITVAQIKKWMANKRVRSNNTLTFNGTIHPKRLQRLQKERHLPARSPKRHHPYSSVSPESATSCRRDIHTALQWNVPSYPISPYFFTMPMLSPM